jgi:nitroreductase
MRFLQLAASRTSVRAYKAEKPSKDEIEYMLEAARLAPSAVNFQPWKFILVTQPEGMSKLYECYPREWFKTVPCAIVACADHTQSWKRSADGKDHANIDVAIATEHICLAAEELCIGTCWVCNFDVDKCKESFNIPDGIEPVVMIPFGYPSSDSKPEKKRKPLSEILVNESF